MLAKSPISKRGPSPLPNGLLSLWDIMLRKAALEFGRALSRLSQLEMLCAGLRAQVPGVNVDHTGEIKKQATLILGNLKQVCIAAAMQDVLPEIDRFGLAVTDQPRIDDVQGRASHLKFRIFDQLESVHYFQVARRDVLLYGQKALFGPKVAKKFKLAAADIELAGSCLALHQPTACVFHVMRAMEVAVRKLSQRLKITISPQTTWRQMTGSMDAKIRTMPEVTERQKRKKNDWEAARANLHAVGSVWRNKTMHPAASYTRAQAHDVLNAARMFMVDLCDL